MELREVSLEDIVSDVTFRNDLGNLDELANSIINAGVRHPITVRSKDNGKYTLIDGHRRFEAAKLAGLSIIQSIIVNDDESIKALQFIANSHRKDLEPLEE